MRTLTEQAAAVARRQVSPVELVESALSAIQRVQPVLNAFTVVLAEDALARAKELEGREPAGALHGVPVAVKDLYDVAGVPTTGCCAPFADRLARADSAVVEALRAAGAIIVGKTNQHELACGATTQVSSFGPCRNPWDHDRIPGGSSGGSGAAVAAGVVSMAMGSDTGGSIRIPSSFCGVTGLKPTHGAVSLRGVMPMCPSFDTAGPLAATAEDCRRVWQVVQGFDPDDPWSQDGRPVDAPDALRSLRIAIPRSFTNDVDPEVVAAVEKAARVFEDELEIRIDEIEGPGLDESWLAWVEIGVPEVADCYRELWDDERISPGLKAFIGLGRAAQGVDTARGIARQRRIRRDFQWALTAADALLAPCTPVPAPRADDLDDARLARLTMPVNVAGLPALALPVGFSPGGLPLGAQLIGRPWSEEVLLQLGIAYQRTTDWHTHTPS